MASTAIRTARALDVEVADALGVRLNELLARLHVRPHQLFENFVDRGRVLDVDSQQHARLWIYRRVPELVGVHLAKTLHARGLRVFAELAHRLVTLGL